MIRYFCDCCGAAISEHDKKGRNTLGRLTATLNCGASKLQVDVIESRDGTRNVGQFCNYCVLDALAKLDDRPTCLPRDTRYDELADALGCDPMDSHKSRVAKARALTAAKETPLGHADENWQALPQRLRGRGDFLRERGQIKDADLMYDAALEIEGLREKKKA